MTESIRKSLSRVEQLLAHAEEEYQQYLHNTNEIVLNYDQLPLPMWVKEWPSLKMLAINQGYRDRIEIGAGEYVGKTDYDVWSKEIADAFIEHDKRVADTGKPICIEETWEVDGKPRSAFVVKYPVYKDEKLVGIGGIIIDGSLLKGEFQDG